MKVNVNTSIRGEFDVLVKRGSKEIVKFSKTNLITDYGLDNILNGDGRFVTMPMIVIGSGSPSTDVKNKSVTTFLSAKDLTHSKTRGYRMPDQTFQDKKAVFEKQAVWNIGEIEGTLSEVGVSEDLTGNAMYTLSGIKDPDTQNTSIELTLEDQLTITYRLEFTLPDDLNYTLTTTRDGESVDVPIVKRTAFKGSALDSLNLAQKVFQDVIAYSSYLDEDGNPQSGVNPSVFNEYQTPAYVSGSGEKRFSGYLEPKQASGKFIRIEAGFMNFPDSKFNSVPTNFVFIFNDDFIKTYRDIMELDMTFSLKRGETSLEPPEDGQ